MSINPEKRQKKMEPAVGFEPTTDGLQNRSSTTELSWLDYPLIYIIFLICQVKNVKSFQKNQIF